jgi:hypothetical protein
MFNRVHHDHRKRSYVEYDQDYTYDDEHACSSVTWHRCLFIDGYSKSMIIEYELNSIITRYQSCESTQYYE